MAALSLHQAQLRLAIVKTPYQHRATSVCSIGLASEIYWRANEINGFHGEILTTSVGMISTNT